VVELVRADLDVMLSGDRLDVTGNDRRALSRVSGQRRAAAPAWTVASVPFTVTGAITKPARIIAVTVSGPESVQRRFGVDLAPGQQSGSIPVGYEADRLDDFDDTITVAAAWATKNVINRRLPRTAGGAR
jgi:hypothetical protein